MSRIEFDFSEGLDALSESLQGLVSDTPEQAERWMAFKASLSLEQMELLWPYLRDKEQKEYALGARELLKALSGNGLLSVETRAGQLYEATARQNANYKEQIRTLREELTEAKRKKPRTEQEQTIIDLKAEIGSLRQSCAMWKERAQAEGGSNTEYNQKNLQKLRLRLGRKDALINRLRREIKDEQTWAEIQAQYAEAIPEPDLAPQWDYKPIERRRTRHGEHAVTAPMFGVETAARAIEEFVKKQGGECSKPDISAAMPHLTCLADAYKHLHMSKRVRVDGMKLTLLGGI